MSFESNYGYISRINRTISNEDDSVMLTESEGNMIRHNYFTRSVKKSLRNRRETSNRFFGEKLPYVDLSRSKINLHETSPERNVNVVRYSEISNPRVHVPTIDIFTRNCSRSDKERHTVNNNGKYMFILTVFLALLITPFVYQLVKYVSISEDFSQMKSQINIMKKTVHDIIKSEAKTISTLSDVEKFLKDIKAKKMKREKNLQDAISDYSNRKSDILSKPIPDVDPEFIDADITDVRGTKTYNLNEAILCSLGLANCKLSVGPEVITKTEPITYGECWAIKGYSGSVVLKLHKRVFISGVMIEHVPKRFSKIDDIIAAPKEFSIWGLLDPYIDNGYFLTKAVYDIDGPTEQSFSANKIEMPYEYVEFKIHSNYGHSDFTCIYRIHFFGKLV